MTVFENVLTAMHLRRTSNLFTATFMLNMKEEKAMGKSGYEVVKAGFARAFWTIMDSNVTTIIAAVVLIVLGTSAVKGFAVTLAVGIGCSLFTSLLLSHLIFDIFITEESFRQVHLGWRRK